MCIRDRYKRVFKVAFSDLLSSAIKISCIFPSLSVIRLSLIHILGIVLSLLGGLPLDKVLNTGVGIAAAMVLLPRMVSLLMEGLAPISRAASDFTKKKLKGRTLLIGMDCALGIGDPTVIAASTIMIPFAVPVSYTHLSLTVLKNGVKFNHPYNDPVKLLFSLVIKDSKSYLNIFNDVLKLSTNKDFTHGVINAKSEKEVYLSLIHI